MRPLRGPKQLHVATLEESGVLGFPSRRGLTPRGSLECNPEIPAFPGEEYELPDTRLGEVSSVLQTVHGVAKSQARISTQHSLTHTPGFGVTCQSSIFSLPPLFSEREKDK